VKFLFTILLIFFGVNAFAAPQFYPGTYFPEKYVSGDYWGYGVSEADKTSIFAFFLKLSGQELTGRVIQVPFDTAKNTVGPIVGSGMRFSAECKYDASIVSTGWGSSIGRPALSCVNGANAPVKIVFFGVDGRLYTSEGVKTHIKVTFPHATFGPLELEADLVKY
jgi:hypothetical protein